MSSAESGPRDEAASPLWALSVSASSRLLRSGSISAAELTEARLARIAEVDDRIHSFNHVAAERARQAAAMADAVKQHSRMPPQRRAILPLSGRGIVSA
jgi:aspartyl-tRNA(Asn)/glutamyl-tRNA(Gln) amidotransferase subunit A